MDEPDDDTCLALVTLHGAEFYPVIIAIRNPHPPSVVWGWRCAQQYGDIGCTGATRGAAARKYCRDNGLFA